MRSASKWLKRGGGCPLFLVETTTRAVSKAHPISTEGTWMTKTYISTLVKVDKPGILNNLYSAFLIHFR